MSFEGGGCVSREYFIAVDDAPGSLDLVSIQQIPFFARRRQRPELSEIRVVNKQWCQRLLEVPLIQLIVRNESR